MSEQILTQVSQKPHSLHNKVPLVSIITLCFNQSAYVIEALESVRSQTYKNIQWIIIDDCSSDNSVQIIEEWIKKHEISCRFIAHEHNKGVLKTLNEGISLTQGKYIALIPADDRWVSNKLEYQVNQMEKLTDEVGVLYSDSYKIDHSGNMLDKLFIETCRNFSTPPTGDIFLELLKGNFIPGSTLLIRKACFDKVGVFDNNLCYEDWDMWLRIASHYQFFFCDKISAYYRISLNSLAQVLFSSKNIPVSLTNFNMFIKYCKHPRIEENYKSILADLLTLFAYELNDLGYKKRSTCLYKVWRYDFRKKVFLFWILACFKLPPTFGHKLVSYLKKIKKLVKKK